MTTLAEYPVVQLLVLRCSIRPDEYRNFSSGINSTQGHIFEGRMNGENAGIYASEVMYLATCLLTGKNEYERISNPEEYRSNQLKIKGIKKISSMRNANPLAYAYMVKSLQLLNEQGLYIDSLL